MSKVISTACNLCRADYRKVHETHKQSHLAWLGLAGRNNKIRCQKVAMLPSLGCCFHLATLSLPKSWAKVAHRPTHRSFSPLDSCCQYSGNIFPRLIFFCPGSCRYFSCCVTVCEDVRALNSYITLSQLRLWLRLRLPYPASCILCPGTLGRLPN